MTTKKFYNEYLTKNIPVHISDGCKNWPATSKWEDKDYLEEQYGRQSILINRISRGYKNGDSNAPFYAETMFSRRNSFNDYVNKTKHATNDG